jgi:hypothetical protein
VMKNLPKASSRRPPNLPIDRPHRFARFLLPVVTE